MKINVIYLEHCKNNQPTGRYAILFSTDLSLMGKWIYLYYKSRFQIEFLFRDAKQYCGLTNCQARDKNKMYFHYNTSLTAVSIAKTVYFLPTTKIKKQPFSMADIKTMNSNVLIAKRIFANLDFNLSTQKIEDVFQKIIRLGCINLFAA